MNEILSDDYLKNNILYDKDGLINYPLGKENAANSIENINK